MDFTLPDKHDALRKSVREFIEEHVLPLENSSGNFDEHENIAHEQLEKVRVIAKRKNLWAPQCSTERGGLNLPLTACAAFYEEANRSIFGPVCLNCAAPDDGNMRVLEKIGTEKQKNEWLQPIVDGDVSSSFAMTEPHPGGGSDPGMIQTTATRDGEAWRIHGRKWFITGAEQASHFIIVAKTSNDSTKINPAGTLSVEFPSWVPKNMAGTVSWCSMALKLKMKTACSTLAMA